MSELKPSRDRELIEVARREAEELARSSLLAGEPPAAGVVRLPPGSLPGYEIVREIQRGSQGVVYRAVHASTRRDVAIKVMLEGPFANPRDRLRFEREVEILGQLKHPNIVTVYDSGEVSGHFYYVMDLVDGPSLQEWLVSGDRSPDDRIRLFLLICDALNAAHLRGVIHRDLKPANVRVDSSGEPHVLDFGLAKHVPGDSNRGAAAELTVTGQFLGSLPWSSPEQAVGDPDQIDIRTDVYSLGVMLYQLLTDRFPYPVVGNLRDVLDNILNAEPLSPGAIDRRVDDELATIALKCLSKDRSRRYQSAGELARDLRRHLAGEPIEAKRDSSLYLLKKTMQRYRLASFLAVGLLLVVVASTVALSLMYLNAASARRESERQRLRAGSAVQRSAEIAVFLLQEVSVRDPFASGTPRQELLEELAQWAQAVETELADQPDLAAEFHTTVGLGYLKAGIYEPAGRHLERALTLRQQSGAPPEQLAQSWHDLGRARFHCSRLEDAVDCYRQALRLRLERFGEQSSEVATTMHHLASCLRVRGDLQEAEELFRAALQVWTVSPEDAPFHAATLNNLATCLRDEGRFDEAEASFRAAVDSLEQERSNPLFVARSWRNIATCRLAVGDDAEAERLLQQALNELRALRGSEHPDVADIEYHLAACRYAQGNLELAEYLCRHALSIQIAALPSLHLQTADSMALLGTILIDLGDLEEAESSLRNAEAMVRALVGEAHPQLAAIWYQFARIRFEQGKRSEAERLARRAFTLQQQKLVETHPDIALSRALLERLGDAGG